MSLKRGKVPTRLRGLGVDPCDFPVKQRKPPGVKDQSRSIVAGVVIIDSSVSWYVARWRDLNGLLLGWFGQVTVERRHLCAAPVDRLAAWSEICVRC